ncbi:epiplakin [Sorex fumeus]|uniref:epiplakin n=1 Tax=Sorex fumeus TaxID=62283 RepID=UPI0024ADC731|nr:epiplakin [Sorex fumeus]
MNGHTASPLDSPVCSSTEPALIPPATKTVPGAEPRAVAEHARSIAGVYVEASGQVLGVYAAMKQNLLPAGLGLALLEAQAATGGLVEPTQGRLLTVAEALRQGLVGLELKEKLLVAERAVTGYPDPYGGEKLALFQAIGKEVVDPALGKGWLQAQLATGGLVDPVQSIRVVPELACQQGLLDQGTWQGLLSGKPGQEAPGFLDPNSLEPLPYPELLGRCVRDSRSGLALLPLKITFRTLSGSVSLTELLEAEVIDEEIARGLQEGRLTATEVGNRAEVRCFLQGSGGLAGVVLLPAGQKKSFSQAVAERLLPTGAALWLLEAQAATCTLVDPASGQRLSVAEAVRAGLVGPELHRQLLVAEEAVTGYHDPFSGARVPLFQAMKKELVAKPLALRLLDAQLATGGLMCPDRRLRLPLKAAMRFGCLDEETRELLSQASGFLDPSTQESLSYRQLLTHSVTDPETGLAFLPLSGGTLGNEPPGPPFIEHSTRQALLSAKATIPAGKFQGQCVSLWELLFFEAIPTPQRAVLAQQYKEGILSMEGLATTLRTTIEQAAATTRVTFPGLRVAVTPKELLQAEIIGQDMYEQLERGQATAQDIGSLDSVHRYLQGTGCIAGLLLPGSQERLSIYEARKKGILRPGTALILLEAQAATGFIIDPKANRRFSVDEALRAGVVGPDVFSKLLSAERAVTGYTDPYTGEQISLFQAMKKELIVHDHGIRLLEAQIATGGIVDPVHSHRVPVDVAYQRGYFDEEMSRVLADPGDDTKGFFDPNTHENLTYLQLLERCVQDPDTGLFLLPLGTAQPQLVDSATRQAFQNLLVQVKHGRFRNQRVSAWELVNSEYFSESRRRQLLQSFRRHQISLQQLAQQLEREMGRWADIRIPTLRGQVTVYQLLEAHIIDQELLEQVLAGAVSPEALMHKETVRRYLRGLGAVAGVLLQPSNRQLNLYQAMKQKVLGPSVALALLEAQAATGGLLDPHSPNGLSVQEAVRRELVGPELYGQLQWAEDAVTGLRDPFSEKQVSLFQAMKKGLIPKEQAARLLEAQVATGGVIDPTGHHHLPTPLAIQRGYIDPEMDVALRSSAETFPTLDGRGYTSYAHLLQQCVRDETSGLQLLPVSEATPTLPTDQQVQAALQATPAAEDGTSLWELLSSGHFTEEQRRAFLEEFRVGKSSVEQLQDTVRKWVQAAELLARARVTVPGPRGPVPAVWLLDAGIITQDTLAGLAEGRQAPEEVAELPEVKASLLGTGCVAGVLLQPSGTKVTIAQAIRNGLLPEGLGRRLLEAQVAAGALVNPLTNQRLSVEGAVRAGLVSGQLGEQLQQTERAVSGYVDPISGAPLSLWQAVEKGLVSRSEGLPLLQVQLATGGVMDPIHGVRLTQEAACRLGFLDGPTSQTLTSGKEDSKFFFDPNTRDMLTYQQLRERCVLDNTTGLRLLSLAEDTALEVDEHTAVALRAMKVPVSAGRFQGHSVSLWDLLHSEYVAPSKRRELAALCQSGRATALRQAGNALIALVEAADSHPVQTTFKGLRKQVSAHDLFQSQLIDKKTLDELSRGMKTVQEVTEMDSVKRFLEGCNFIAGVIVQSTQEKMSISEALQRHLLRPGTALVLLEAQAATGFLIDPVHNRRLTVQDAFAQGLFGKETYQKLLSAERAVTGYTDPYTGEQISLFQAMKKELIVRDHGIRLLEAQIATGGIIDPVHSHRVPVDVAYQRGYFDEEMSRVLADPGDDTKGFFDPNTHENLTYLQLLERCVRDPDTGLFLLQVVKKGEEYIYIDDATRQALQAAHTTVHVGRFAQQTVSIWELLSSPYFTEERKRGLAWDYRAQRLSLEQLLETIVATIEETERKSSVIKVAGTGGEVTAAQLFNSGIIDKKALDALHAGTNEQQDLSQQAQVKTYLEGSGCIAGVMVPSTQEVLSFCEACRKGLIPAGLAVQMLEAQAATGFLLDPHSQQKLSVDEAVAKGLVDEELRERLLNAGKAAQGFEDPATGDRLSLLQAMQKKLIKREDALRLLEVQVATGGALDPWNHHRLPLDTAYRRGCLSQDTYMLVADKRHMKKRFLDPNTQQKVTYQEMQEKCHRDEKTGWILLPLDPGAEDSMYIDEATRRALEAEHVDVQVGRYRGQRPSVWELLNSEYVTEKEKIELVRQYKEDTKNALTKVVQVIYTMIEDREKRNKTPWFRGLRKQVTAAELCQSGIISKDVLQALDQGSCTVQDVQKEKGVQRYLEGESCIAGVLVPSRDRPGQQEKMSIYQAMWKGVLRPGTALVLLEAQAATGFIIDPVHDRRLSVEEAVAAGVVGGEIRDKLLSAERAVTGYTDPYTGEQISLFQAMKKELIVHDHGIRLLEAQIATGGIVDPVHSHRVPVDVAYQRGYFDEEMSRVLADPGDDTKGFFDPNTHENLTYLQLLRRCVRDPDTGLYMLQLAGPRSALHQLSEELRAALRQARVAVGAGSLRGQSLSVWELLFYREVSEDLRQELLRGLGAGSLSVQDVGASLVSQLARAEEGRPAPADLRESLRAATMEVRVGRLRGPVVPVWDVLASGYLSGPTREQLLAQFGAGSLGLSALTRRLTTIIEEAEEAEERARARCAEEAAGDHLRPEVAPRGPEAHTNGDPDASRADSGGDAGADASDANAARRQQEQALRAATMQVSVGQFQGQAVALWDVLWSSYVSQARREELLAQHAAGALALPALEAVLTQLIEEAEERLSQVRFRGLRHQVSASQLGKSGILDADTLRGLAQGTKSLREVTEMDSVRRYLEGESCIAGVLVPSRDRPGQQEKMSIYQAMWKGVLRPGTALVLLEAQAATGFIIDPVHDRRLSVEEAVAAGVVGGEIRDKLLSAERAVTGYTDPYTGEQISLFQAMKKELIVHDHGIRLLEAQIATGGIVDPVHSHRVPVDVAYQRGYFDEEMSRVLADPGDDTKGFFDPNTHENLTYLQLLRRCVRDPDTGLYMLQLAGPRSALHQLSEELRAALRQARVAVGAGSLRGQSLSVWELLFYREVSEDLRQELLRGLGAGSLSVQDVGASLVSQLARAEEGRPAPADLRESLRAATMEVRVGRLRGPVVPVWDVLASGYLSGPTREQLLAQFGAGSLGLSALTRRLTTIIEEAEEAEERARARCAEEAAGDHLRPEVAPRGPEAHTNGDPDASRADSGGDAGADASDANAARRQQEQALRAATMQVSVGQFQGQAVALWDVLWSSYVSPARREELLAQHAAGALALPALEAVLTQLIEEAEERLSQVRFRGLRHQVSASQLGKSGILDADTLRGLAQGTKSLREVTEMDSVRRYLEGESCIAGVLVPSRDRPGQQEKMSIYQAMWKGVLRPGTALVLLEAQAATGFIIDPVHDRRLSVEEAVAAGVVGGEIRDKLLSAERAVTGYTDPYTGEQISLFQAMKKELIVHDHGIRLLEAQIATGGIVDPVHSHRVPVDVAYQRGYFDEEMSRVLADPGDDTKGFFDPNTHENLTYLQLLRRCVRDPDTGLYMLQLAGPRSALHQLSEELRAALRQARVAVGAGSLRGQSLSVWELLFYREVSEDLRQELLRGLGAGSLSVQDVGASLVSQLARAEEGRPAPADLRESLRAATMEVRVGRLRGPVVPVWDVLASGYLSGPTREQLLAQFGAGSLGLSALTRRLTTIIEEAEEAEERARSRCAEEAAGDHLRPEVAPRGPEAHTNGDPDASRADSGGDAGADASDANAARRQQEQALRAATMQVSVGQFQGQAVALWDVLWSSYVSPARREELLAQHAAGALALPALEAVLTQLIEEAEERLSQVRFRGLRHQVSASQLGKSGILDADTLRGLAQGTKSLREVTEMDSVRRYLEGESCIAGVLVPSRDRPGQQEKMSIYQAMWKGVLRPGTALVLLEAQAATGFIIDPVHDRRLSVEEAVAAGVVGGEIRDKLLSAERAVTGYTDPYTGEQISLFQAMKKELIVHDHGIRLLEAQIATGGIVDPVHSHRVPVDVAYQRGYFDEEMSRVLADPGDDTKGFFDPNTHENLTYLQLLRRCVRDPDTGLYMLQLAGPRSALHQLSEELRAALRQARVAVGAGSLRGQSLSVWELLFYREVSEDLRQELLRGLGAGSLSVQDVGASLVSQLARAEEGRPAPADLRESLRAATMEVRVGRLRGPVVPVWDVLASGYLSGPTREQLLAQFGAGSLGLSALTRRLTTIIEEAEEAEERARARCAEEAAGDHLRPEVAPRGPEAHTNGDPDASRADSGGDAGADASDANAARRQQEQALRAATMQVSVGQFQGQAVALWDVLWSSYVSPARREELLAQHAAGALALPALEAVLTQLIEEAEERLSQVRFRGLRHQVSASQLGKSGILDADTLRGLAQGTKSLREVTEMDSVRRYLEGESCIAGVLVPSRDRPGQQEKMSIYQAMWKGVLRPGTALVLLEAQAATGFIIDPVHDRRLSVEEAVAAGVVGGEIRDKLLSAERAVTGYTDPYTGEQISLFQAMKKELIVHDHGIRLLEAQIATGGIVDPVHSHRVPVDVAYQRGYFDEEMSRVLADPGDDTKGFFDPNTHENLTYLQLLRRCVRDPDTGLYMLQLAGPRSALHQLSEELRAALRQARVAVGAGSLRGQSLSVWELLFYREVSEDLRQELLRGLGAGSLSVQDVGASLVSQLARAEEGRPAPADLRESLRAATMEVRVGRLRGPVVPVWDVLASGYLSGPTREQLLAQFGAGSLGLSALTRRLTTIIEEAEEAEERARARCAEEAAGDHLRPEVAPRGPEAHTNGDPDASRADSGGDAGADASDANAARRQQEQALRAATMQVSVGQFQGQAVALWDVLWSSYVSPARREELLAQHAAGALALPALEAVLTQLIEEAEERLSQVRFRGLRHQVSASQLGKSGILDADTLRGLAQGTKSLREVTEMDSVRRYLEGESCIAGVLVPSRDRPGQQEKMSIYQAMWKGVLRPGTALVLLEAQAATGFIIDPVHDRRLSVEEAVAAGVVGGEIRDKLLSAERAVTGYTDPYTGEQISLFQAMKKELIVHDHGIRLLEAQIATGGIVDPVHSHRVPVDVAYQRGYFDEEMSRVLADPGDDTKGFFDPNTHENLTYLQLLRRCVRDPDTGLYMLQLAGPRSALHQLSEELRAALRQARVAVGAGSLRGQSLSVWELLFYREVSEDLRQELLRGLGAGSLSVQDVGASLVSQLARAEEGRPAPADLRESLRAATMEVRVGRLRGPVVPVWDVLASGYLSGPTREQLLAQFGAGSLGLSALTRRLTTIIEEAEEAEERARARCAEEAAGDHLRPEVAPRGPEAHTNGDPDASRADSGGDAGADASDANAARRQQEQALRAATMQVSVGQFQGQAVALWDVLWSSYVSPARREELLAQHAAGALALPALEAVLTQLIEEAEERLSQVRFRGLRHQVSASQLGKSGILDADTLRGLAQGTKSLREVTEMDSVRRYLEGESCIAGVLVPSRDRPGQQEKMSIYQAMWKGVLRPGTALVLLEAQAATGFIIDPVHDRRLSVEEAVAAGVVGGEIRDKLLSAERAVTGYTDPYTGEQISLFQAMKKELIVHDHGIRLLEAQIATGGIVDPVHSHRVPVDVAYQRGYFDEEMSRVLADPGDDTKGFFDPNTHENLTYLQLLRRCVRDPDTGLYMLQLAGPRSALHQLSEELRAALRQARVAVGAGSLRGQSLSVWELLFYREVSEDLRQELLRGLGAGSLSVQDVGASLVSQLARAEEGRPAPADLRESLRAATMEVRVGRLRGPVVPVWDVLASGYLSGPTREQLLAQFGAGSLGLSALTRRLTTIIEEAEEAEERARARCAEEAAGDHLRPEVAPRGPEAHTNGDPDASRADSGGDAGADASDANAARRQQEQALRAATMQVSVGQFQGQAVALWDVLWSSYVSPARREELLAQHAAGALALPALEAVLTQLIEEAEERLSQVRFRGLRHQVSASQLGKSGILDADTLRGLAQGTKSLREVTEMDSVRRYLEGESCIAGVLVPSRDRPGQQEKMSIYQAMWKGVLRPGTALVLLEAQAATGFIIDPVHDRRLSVEEAVAAGVVGGEIRDKLLSAERAVTGYTDPYTGEQISLFQAMKKELIVHDHGIRLLEAQIATGGIVDPVHSHRVPVDVAYQRGYFDEEMSRVLADPGDDTKGFFDPNTHENLTYLQLLRRCVRDPDTGLYMLQLAGPRSALHQLSEELRAALRQARVAVGAGSLRGQSLSVWELLFYREVSEDLRQELLRGLGAGSLSVQDVGASLVSQLARAEEGRPAPADLRESLRAATMEVRVGRLRGPVVPVWDVLASGYLSGPTREQLLAQFGAGSLGLSALTRRLTTIIEEAEEAEERARARCAEEAAGDHLRPEVAPRGPEAHTNGDPDASRADSGGDAGADASDANAARRQQEQALRAATMQVSVGQFQGQAVALWDVLWSSYVSQARREELLAQHAAGALALPALEAVLTQLIEEAEERLSQVRFRGLRHQVSASQLGKSGILDADTLRGLAQGTKSLREVTEMDSVRRYLEGESCIAGVLVPSRDRPGQQEKMSIYQAMWKGVLRPGTALVLLEAQAATGFIIDPVHDRRLSVEEAVAAGVVGGEIRDKLLSAERAVTGYTDPYTGEQISLFQAMKKELIVHDHGIRLLEAQIATGGIVDPVHSHRVPVDVAYQRGYFDEEMSRVLADPGDDTKGFFDPNTHENLTYLQLMERCVRDPDSGLLFLSLS